MSDSGNGRVVVISTIISTVIAGMFTVFTKAVPEGSLRLLSPHEGGTVVRASPLPVCQLIRFWVPQQLKKTASGRPLEQITEELNKAITNSFGGWTKWQVSGEWKDGDTQIVYREGGYIYEVGTQSCSDLDVERLYNIVTRFVAKEMNQVTLYFVATKFDKAP